MEYDICVVGAGPGGLNAAYHSAKLGMKVVVIEKKKKIGIPVHCGEGIFLKLLYQVLEPGNYISRTINKIKIVQPKWSKTLHLRGHKGAIMDKDKMLEFIAKKVIELGGKIKLNTKFKERYEYPAKIYIDGSGIEAVLGEWIPKLKKEDVASCSQYNIKPNEKYDKHTIEIYFEEPIAQGYSWVFPKKDSVNIGMDVAGGFGTKPSLHIQEFIKKRFPNFERISSFNAVVPCACPPKSLVRSNTILTGDAARLANPLSGGGIYPALYSGMVAGIEASRWIKGDNNALKRYENIIKKDLYKIIVKAYKVKTKCIHNLRKRQRLYKYLKLMMYLYRISPRFGEKYIFRNLS